MKNLNLISNALAAKTRTPVIPMMIEKSMLPVPGSMYSILVIIYGTSSCSGFSVVSFPVAAVIDIVFYCQPVAVRIFEACSVICYRVVLV